MQKKILLLGSGELGKELVISLQRLGQYVIAVDSYAGAPAQQVAHEFEVINMLNGDALDELIARHRPDLIVPEVEAIRTERLYEYEKAGIGVVPSARAANFTMNRKAIRDLAARDLQLRTADYRYAVDIDTFRRGVKEIGIPCVVKPLMSSSGKGQSIVRSEADIETSWKYAMEGTRGDLLEVIIEEFIEFESEITLLTVTQKNGPTLFCPPIGHRQERGDYQESWQPHAMPESWLREAEDMAAKVTQALGGAGIWGVEYFLTKKGVYFSELSPRPHDTGMVTLAGTQTFNEFELHARAILGLPIPVLKAERKGASAVILAREEGVPEYAGLSEAMSEENTDIRIFGKPVTRAWRRMGVALAWSDLNADIMMVREKAARAASKVSIQVKKS